MSVEWVRRLWILLVLAVQVSWCASLYGQSSLAPPSNCQDSVRIDTVLVEAPTCTRGARLTVVMIEARSELQFQYDNAGLQSSNVLLDVPSGLHTISAYLPGRCADRVEVDVPAHSDTLIILPPARRPPSCVRIRDGLLTPADQGDAVEYALNDNVYEQRHTYAGLGVGTQRLYARTRYGCTDTLEVVILPEDVPTKALVIQGPTHELSLGSTVQLRVDAPWTPALTQPIAWEANDTRIECIDALCTQVATVAGLEARVAATAIDSNGCTYTGQYLLPLRFEDGLFLPNAFSPNADGSNDAWRPLHNELVREVTGIRVFDRWGAEVWQWKLGDAGVPAWDGLYRDAPAAEGVYIVQVNATFADGIERQVYEAVTLVR